MNADTYMRKNMENPGIKTAEIGTPEFDKLTSENDVFDEMVADAEEALANESGIKSLNFR